MGTCTQIPAEVIEEVAPVLEKPVKSSKRSKPQDSDTGDCDEEELRRKRSRGRPRLDTKDETAADRRRTQIRLAQRAYRHRKDTAISTLEQRVKNLEQDNKDLGREFSTFFDLVSAEGLLVNSPQAANQLKALADKLLQLAPSPDEASNDTEGSSASPAPSNGDTYTDGVLKPGEENVRRLEEITSPLKANADGASPVKAASSVEHAHPLDALGNFEVTGSSMITNSSPSLHMPDASSFEIVTQSTPDNASFPFYASMEPQSQNSYIRHVAHASPYSALPTPSSYAFQEKTFGRRLQRSTLESALKLMSLSSPPPERYAAVFGFCLLFEPRESIIRRLTIGLNRVHNESISYWKVPFTNLGGAGLHPLETNLEALSPNSASAQVALPIGNQGLREIEKPKDVTGFSMGPFNPLVEATRDGLLDNRMRMMSQGFEGEFFDSDEVELYLRQVGIVIPQHVDFIEAEVDLNELQDIPGPVLNGGPATERGHHPSSKLAGPFGFMSQTTSVSGMWPSVDFSNAVTAEKGPLGNSPSGTVPQLNPTLPGYTETVPGGVNNGMMESPICNQTWSNWTRTKLTISVGILIKEMVSRSVCLGRTSGIRPKDVNRAIQIASGLYGTF